MLRYVLILGLVLVTPTAFADKLQEIIDRGVLRVGTTGDWKPMSVRNTQNGRYEGFDIEWSTQLAADMNVEIEYVPTEWKTLVSGLTSDRYDISTSASISPSRALVTGYSESYMEVSTVPLTLKENVDRFTSWASINQPDVTVAVTLGTTFDDEARSFFPDAEIIAVEAPAREYQDVLSGRALVFITSNVEAATLIAQYPQLTVIPVAEARSRRPIAALLPQAEQTWINYVNHWVTLKKASGYFDELGARWLGQ
ncbi:MAG: transporter substrate-binding domain-containing protein [Pseudomonadota bacterium]